MHYLRHFYPKSYLLFMLNLNLTECPIFSDFYVPNLWGFLHYLPPFLPFSTPVRLQSCHSISSGSSLGVFVRHRISSHTLWAAS